MEVCITTCSVIFQFLISPPPPPPPPHIYSDRLASSVLSLFNGVCEFAFGSDPPLVTHYQSMVHSFEPREDDLDRWHGMTLGEYPRIVSDESYCGRHSLLVCAMYCCYLLYTEH